MEQAVTARDVFGAGYAAAERYAHLLASAGVERGLIGPREVERLWDRHLLNSAVLGELIPPETRVLDVGSGAGLPGIPLALARPDLKVTLLEPMARRVTWLRDVVDELGVSVDVRRGRAEDAASRRELGLWSVVTARAVAPLARLASWCLPLVESGGRLLAIKGASAADEVVRDRSAVRAAGGEAVEIVQCGTAVVQPPATVVVVRRSAERSSRAARTRRKDR